MSIFKSAKIEKSLGVVLDVLFALVLLFINKDKLNADNFRRLAAKIDIGFSSDKSADNSIIDYDYNSSEDRKSVV